MISTIGELLATRPARITGDASGALSFGRALRGATVCAAKANSRTDGPARVALLVPAGPALAGALLGVMSGATALPLNPRLTVTELAFTLDDAAVDVLLVDADYPHAAAAVAVARSRSIPVVDLAEVAEEPLGRATTVDRVADDIALLLHTSGTTARPKLVPLRQRNLLASAAAVARSLGLTHDDRGLAVMPLFHIHGIIGSLLSSVWAQATLHVVPFDAFRFQTLLSSERITWTSAVPTMYQAMLSRPAVELPGTLRFARSSSSPLSTPIWTGMQERLGCMVVNSYGMTEASHQMASTPTSVDSTFFGTVGRAAGPEIAVVTPSGLMSRGLGELVIRGDGVIVNYLSPASANDDAFVDGWFRTGDTGTIDDGDVIRLLGRLKELINVGGEKVSPFEVDDVLLAHPAVAEAVAFAAPSELLGEVVHAAVVLSSDLDAAALRRHAREHLAKCKVPTRIHFVTEIPKGSTGKVQRIHLAAQLGLSSEMSEGDARSGR